MLILLRKFLKITRSYLAIEIFILLFLYTAIFFIFCDNEDFSGLEDKEDETSFERLFNMFYFSCVTCSTIGYGDIYPKTMKSRFICSTLILIVLYLSLVG